MNATIKKACASGLIAVTVVAAIASAQAGPKIPKSHGKTPIEAQYLGGVFNDGGGTIIIPTKHGGLVRRIVPPMQPVMPSEVKSFAY